VPSTTGVVQPAALGRALRLAGVTESVAESAAALSARLDSSAFSAAGTATEGALAEALALVRSIDVEAIRLTRLRGATRSLVIIGAAVLAAAAAHGMSDGLSRTFADGVSAYDHGAFTTSQRAFARVAARAPRAADAWANLGAASWSRGDSAAAARAWQRAMRIDPLDDESRDRLEAFAPPTIRSSGYVPPVSVGLIALPALACWILAWILLALPLRLQPPASRPLAGGALSVAVVLLLGALELNERLDTAPLGVLRQTRPLTEAPGSLAALATGTIGETGRISAREGAWIHIAIGSVAFGLGAGGERITAGRSRRPVGGS
jgi:hypothetical protein